MATWQKNALNTTNASFTVWENVPNTKPIPVNQQNSPSSETADDGNWQLLSNSFTVAGNTLRVQLTNAQSGLVVADAIRIVRIGDVPTPAVRSAVAQAFALSAQQTPQKRPYVPGASRNTAR